MGPYRVFRRLLIIFMATASLAAIPIATTSQAASAGTRTPRVAAYIWAYHHAAGHSYCWGGTGPSCYDCSGVVMAAYAREGITFGRSTTAMLDSGRLIRESSARRAGVTWPSTAPDMWSSSSGLATRSVPWTPGPVIGWHQWNSYWHPTMFFRVRGAG